MMIGDRVIYYKIYAGVTLYKEKGVVTGFTKKRIRVLFDNGRSGAVNPENISPEVVGERNKVGLSFARDELGFCHRGSFFEVTDE